MENTGGEVCDEICNNDAEENESKKNKNKDTEHDCSGSAPNGDNSNLPKNETSLKFSISRILDLDGNNETRESKPGQ